MFQDNSSYLLFESQQYFPYSHPANAMITYMIKLGSHPTCIRHNLEWCKRNRWFSATFSLSVLGIYFWNVTPLSSAQASSPGYLARRQFKQANAGFWRLSRRQLMQINSRSFGRAAAIAPAKLWLVRLTGTKTGSYLVKSSHCWSLPASFSKNALLILLYHTLD